MLPYRVPAEWVPHKAIWTIWPGPEERWPQFFHEVRAEVTAMIRALAEGDQVQVLVRNEADEAVARRALPKEATFFVQPYGDVWLRDTGPVFAYSQKDRERLALTFQFNGWGHKYLYPDDIGVNDRVALCASVKAVPFDFILEGGSVDPNGEGIVLTTEQCLLNANRNPAWTRSKAEEALAQSYGALDVVWLKEGLINDHTDGHVDNIARFIARDTVLCQTPDGPHDPNAKILEDIYQTLSSFRTKSGDRLRVLTVPSPGEVRSSEGEIMPASHMNFIIGNKTVIVPIYNETGTKALNALEKIFPAHKVVGVSSRALLSQGGSFHCITQQEPL